jgi:hypothetical protein
MLQQIYKPIKRVPFILVSFFNVFLQQNETSHIWSFIYQSWKSTNKIVMTKHFSKFSRHNTGHEELGIVIVLLFYLN